MADGTLKTTVQQIGPNSHEYGFSSLRGLTPIDLLILLAIFAIIAVMLDPLPPRMRPAYASRARQEMRYIEEAILKYESTYERLPVSTNIEQSGLGDFTFGTVGTETVTTVTNGGVLEANNSELMCIVMDLKVFRNGKPTPNHDGSLNRRGLAFLNAKFVQGSDMPGVGEDGVYRDPWGNPYIITIDLDSNGRCRDAFYSRANVSATDDITNGFYGLIRQTNSSGAVVYESQSRVMVWSFGPDGKADPNKKANRGVNKDNVLGWRE